MPAELRRELLEEFGDVIDEVRVVEHSWINVLHLRPLAVTRRNRIYLRADAAGFYADRELVFHEYFHVLRQWSADRLTVARYLLACLRYGYWNNPFEVEARRFAARHRRPAGGPVS